MSTIRGDPQHMLGAVVNLRVATIDSVVNDGHFKKLGNKE